MLIHTADPKEYWYPLTYNSLHYGLRKEQDQHYHNPEMATWAELIRQRDHVLEKHPHTTFIGATPGESVPRSETVGRDAGQVSELLRRLRGGLRMLGRLNPPAVRTFS